MWEVHTFMHNNIVETALGVLSLTPVRVGLGRAQELGTPNCVKEISLMCCLFVVAMLFAKQYDDLRGVAAKF